MSSNSHPSSAPPLPYPFSHISSKQPDEQLESPPVTLKEEQTKVCDACREGKRRCDGTAPCSNCYDASEPCVYPDPTTEAAPAPISLKLHEREPQSNSIKYLPQGSAEIRNLDTELQELNDSDTHVPLQGQGSQLTPKSGISYSLPTQAGEHARQIGMVQRKEEEEEGQTLLPRESRSEGEAQKGDRSEIMSIPTSDEDLSGLKLDGLNLGPVPLPSAASPHQSEPFTAPKLLAVGDRVPFTLRSRHMAAYIATMSAEQQEGFDIEVAQRRLRMRNARKAEEARKKSEVKPSSSPQAPKSESSDQPRLTTALQIARATLPTELNIPPADSFNDTLSWTNQDPRESVLFNSWGVLYRFQTTTVTNGQTTTTLWRAIRPNKEDRVAKLEWAPGHGFGRLVIGKRVCPISDLVRPDPQAAGSRIFTGPDGLQYRWRPSPTNADTLLQDENRTIIAFFHPTRPTRYQFGDVYGELHLLRPAGAGTVMHPPMMDMVIVTAMLYRFCAAWNL